MRGIMLCLSVIYFLQGCQTLWKTQTLDISYSKKLPANDGNFYISNIRFNFKDDSSTKDIEDVTVYLYVDYNSFKDRRAPLRTQKSVKSSVILDSLAPGNYYVYIIRGNKDDNTYRDPLGNNSTLSTVGMGLSLISKDYTSFYKFKSLKNYYTEKDTNTIYCAEINSKYCCFYPKELTVQVLTRRNLVYDCYFKKTNFLTKQTYLPRKAEKDKRYDFITKKWLKQ